MNNLFNKFKFFKREERNNNSQEKHNFENYKIQILDNNEKENNIDPVTQQNITNLKTTNQNFNSSSKWIPEYTYPPDRNIIKFRLPGLLKN